MKSLKKINMKSQYRNIFFGRFLALYFALKPAGWVVVFKWFIETTLAGWVLASSVCA